MKIRIESRHLGEVTLLAPEVFEDERGFFMETFRADQFKALGLPFEFVQDNHSGSTKNVLRGLHFQWGTPHGQVDAGDIRQGIPCRRGYSQRVSRVGTVAWPRGFSAADKRQVWAPAGFAPRVLCLSNVCEIQYKCTGTYNKMGEGAILWNDPEIGIEWPVRAPVLSVKDANAPTLREWLASADSDHFSTGAHKQNILGVGETMKLFVAAGAGYIGSVLIPELLDRGYANKWCLPQGASLII